MLDEYAQGRVLANPHPYAFAKLTKHIFSRREKIHSLNYRLVLLLSQGNHPMVCTSLSAGRSYKVNDQISCNRERYQAVTVKIWNRNIKQWKTPATSLVVSQDSCKTHTSTKVKEEKSSGICCRDDQQNQEHIVHKSCETVDGEVTETRSRREAQCQYAW